MTETQETRIACETIPVARTIPTLIDDVAKGLLNAPRVLPPKYFYDEHGSTLFDRICETPEYYVTRTEDALLEDCAKAIIEVTAPDDILELGSGTSRKTRRLLDACETLGYSPSYSPFDISPETLLATAEQLTDEYDWLNVNVLVGDYEGGLTHLPTNSGHRLFCFLGSTIGNFEHARAVAFLKDLRSRMTGNDMLLLGADRVKDDGVLHAAYNDEEGLTAAFNLNLLNVLNRRVDADFDPSAFEHRAFFNEAESRIEMHLVSRREHSVTIGALGQAIRVDEGEAILTEISRKFTERSLAELLSEAGFAMAAHYTPSNEFFSLALAHPLDS
jgi:L-histidine N-alpha-methyltransferase